MRVFRWVVGIWLVFAGSVPWLTVPPRAEAQAPPPVVGLGAFVAPDRPLAIDFSALAGELWLLSDDEVIEQLRDWALLSAVAQVVPKPPRANPQLAELLLSLPPTLRRPALNGLREAPYGPGRLAVLGTDQCLVLTPAVAAAGGGRGLRFDAAVACRLIDAHRLLDGRTPATVRLVTYTAEPDRRHPRLLITFLGTVSGAEFDTPAYGYVRMRVTSAEQLDSFLARIDDLLEVRYTDDGQIELSGRKYAPTLFQRSPRRIDRADLRTIRNAGAGALTRPANERWARSDLAFSLDPWIDAQPLSEALRRLIDSGTGNLQASDPLRARLEDVTGKLGRSRPFMVPDSADGDETGLFALLDALRPAALDSRGRATLTGPTALLEALDDLVDRERFQAPRYEGGIGGTEVGMTLYYTDLIAKLYAMGAIEQLGGGIESLKLPGGEHPLLRPVPEIQLAAFQMPEVRRLSYSRLWWGPRTAGFLQEEGGRVRFDPVAVTLSVRSRAMETDEEVGGNILHTTFATGWNRRFLAIADISPEFHRLNQLMKWSFVFKAAADRGATAWDFLDAGPNPDHTLRFDSWYARALGTGRIADQVRLPLAHARPDAPSESLEIIRSRPYKSGGIESPWIATLVGGVDGVSSLLVRTRTAARRVPLPGGLPADIEVSEGRYAEWLQGVPVPVRGGGTIARELDGRQVAVSGPSQARLRAPGVEVPTAGGNRGPVLRTRIEFTPQAGSLVLDGTLESGNSVEALGRLAIRPANADRIVRLEWEAKGLDQDLAILGRVAEGRTLEPPLAADLRYDRDGQRLFFPPRDAAGRWLEVTMGTDPNLPGIKYARVGRRDWLLASHHEKAALEGIDFIAAPGARYLRVQLDGTTSTAWLVPREALRWSLVVDGEPGELAYAGGDELFASGRRAGEFLRRVGAADRERLRTAMKNESEQGLAHRRVYLEGGKTLVRERGRSELRLEAPPTDAALAERGIKRLSFVARDERFDLEVETADADEVERLITARLDEMLPYASRLTRVTPEALESWAYKLEGLSRPQLKVESAGSEFTLTDPESGERFVLSALAKRVNLQQPLPALFDVLRTQGRFLDISAIPPNELPVLTEHLVRLRVPRLYTTKSRGWEARMKKAHTWRLFTVDVESRSLNKVRKYGALAREILEKKRLVEGPGFRVEFIIGHADEGRSYDAMIKRRAAAGEFRDRHLIFAICNESPSDLMKANEIALEHGAASTINATGLVDIPAAALVASWAHAHPERLAGVTTAEFLERAYEETLREFERCLDAPVPTGAIRDFFGEKELQLFLKANRELDHEAINRTLRSLKSNGKGYIQILQRFDAAPILG
jgi:hypothetical protein